LKAIQSEKIREEEEGTPMRKKATTTEYTATLKRENKGRGRRHAHEKGSDNNSKKTCTGMSIERAYR